MRWRGITPAEPPPAPVHIEPIGSYEVEVFEESTGEFVAKLRTPAWAATGPLFVIGNGQTVDDALIDAGTFLGFEPDL
jgi:hypothetical protein